MWLRAWLTVALRGPGRVLFGASAVGWLALAGLTTVDRQLHSALMLSHGHGAGATTAVFHARDVSAIWLAIWLTMLVVMAPPLLLREIGYLWRTSLRRLRHLTIALFVCGYMAIWLLFGLAARAPGAWIAAVLGRIAIAVALLLLWHCSPARQRCLNACHRVPTVRLFGTAALWDALRYGLSAGGWCTATCGPLMLFALLATDYHLTVMTMATVLTTIERYLPGRRPAWQLPIVPRRSPNWPDLTVAATR